MKWIVLSLTLALAACERAPAAVTPEPEPVAAPKLAPREGPSLYQAEMDLVDQDGKQLDLAVFAGKPVLVTMFYANCPYACPLLISDIKRALAALEPSVRAETRVLLVSLDPGQDTPQSMKELARLHRVDEPGWRFTRAAEEDVVTLAALLGVKYKKLDSGQIQHTSVITVLDRRGVSRHRSEGFFEAGDPTLPPAIAAVASEPGTVAQN
jgi:protein SCO1